MPIHLYRGICLPRLSGAVLGVKMFRCGGERESGNLEGAENVVVRQAMPGRSRRRPPVKAWECGG
jgi:hypothetical protein